MPGLFNKTQDLYGSLWGKADEDGLFNSFYTRAGAPQQLKSYKQRLGADISNLGQTDVAPSRPIDLTSPPPINATPVAPVVSPIKKKYFGFPLWFYLVIVGTYFVARKS